MIAFLSKELSFTLGGEKTVIPERGGKRSVLAAS